MSKIITTQDFIERARSIHGEKYDYSKVLYKRAKDKVCIICPEHGEFLQAPDKHLHGRGCPKCARPNSNLTQEEFISNCRKRNNDKYDYSKTIYNGYNNKVLVTCPTHGDFLIAASQHLAGHGCLKCANCYKYTTGDFIKKHRERYGDKYDYSKTDAEHRIDNKICVICPEHGAYYKTIKGHLGKGCPKCSVPNYNLTTEGFIKKSRCLYGEKYTYEKSIYNGIYSKVWVTCNVHGDIQVLPNNFLRGRGCKKCACEELARLRIETAASDFEGKARLIHGDKYDYSKVQYVTAHDKVCIVCPEHGEFWQTPNGHLNGYNCPKCVQRTWPLTTSEFIERAKSCHGDKYDYSQTKYVNLNTNVTVSCKKHGPFEINPRYHLVGGICTTCIALKMESNQEHDVRLSLERHSIRYDREKQFKWLRRGRVMPLDFYLPDYNIAIECQGLQHFKSHPFFGGMDGLKDIMERDSLKKKLCDEHGVRILYYSNLKIRYPYYVIQSMDELLQTIINGERVTKKPVQLELDFKF